MSRADRRQAIIKTAAELFSESGFRGVTTRELAKRVGVSEPVLYEHFATKRDLYAAIINEASHIDIGAAIRDLQAIGANDQPPRFFTHLAESIIDFHNTHPTYLRLILFSALEKHDLAELCFEGHATVVHKIVAEFIQRQTENGRFREVDANLAARSFLGMVLHYSIFDQHFGFKLVRATKKKSIATMVDIFLRGLEKK